MEYQTTRDRAETLTHHQYLHTIPTHHQDESRPDVTIRIYMQMVRIPILKECIICLFYEFAHYFLDLLI